MRPSTLRAIRHLSSRARHSPSMAVGQPECFSKWESASMKLRDKVVLVTGASKGIGRAIAIGLAREGANLIVNYASDKAGADATVKEIEGLGRAGMVVQADISRVAQIKRMFRKVTDKFGRVDVLVNNAGITGWTPLFETTEEQWDQVIETNLKGTFFCSLEAARLM